MKIFAAKTLLILLFIMKLTSTSNQFPVRRPRFAPLPYEVMLEIDETTEQMGSIILLCRDDIAENIPVNEVKFRLNLTDPCDPSTNATSLRERGDFNVVEVDDYRIKFNLTRGLEGNYTCGRRVNSSCMVESRPKTLICKFEFKSKII